MANNKDKKILNVPALRFPEFTDEWIFAPLYDYLEVNRERNRNDEFDKGAVLSVSGDYGIVNQIQLLGRSFAGSSVKDYHVVRKGNIVYTKSPLKEYPYGIVKVNKGNEGIVSTLYAVYNVKHNAVGGFIESYFALPKRTNRYFKPIVRIGAKHDMKIGNEEAIANIVCFPSHAEQRKIAAFLSLLDQRISIQNKIIEDLKKLKSAIDKLYSSTNGEIYSFRQLFEVVNEKNKARAYKNVLSASQELGMIERSDINIDIKFEQESISGYKIVHKGDYVVHLRSFQGGFAFSDRTGICSPAYIILRPNDLVVYGYLSHFFTSKPFIKSLKLVTYGIRDGRSINVDEWLDMPILLPPAQEQIRILTIVNAIDAKLHNEVKVQFCLSSQKSYLLNTMFI